MVERATVIHRTVLDQLEGFNQQIWQEPSSAEAMVDARLWRRPRVRIGVQW